MDKTTVPLAREELNAIRQRADAATPGPFEWTPGELTSRTMLDSCLYETGEPPEWPHDYATIIVTDGGHYPPHGPDRDFYGRAWEDVRTLLAEVERLKQLVGED